MPLVAAIPGNTPSGHDGSMSVDQLKASITTNSSAYRGASVINLLGTAKKAADAALLKEEAGDLQDALIKYYQARSILKAVVESAEFKAESAPGKHGAVWQTVSQFLENWGGTINPRIQRTEARWTEVLAARASAADPSTAFKVVNGATSPKQSPNSRSQDEGKPNETSGGSIQDRMRKLAQAGVDTHIAQSSSKRLSHQSTPSTSTLASLQSPITPRSSAQLDDRLVSLQSPSAPAAPSSVSMFTNGVSLSTSSSRGYEDQFEKVQAGPSAAPQSPTFPVMSPSLASTSTSFSAIGRDRSPSASPRLNATEVRRHGTGGSGVSSSPRHHPLHSISGSPRLRDPILPTPKSQPPPSPLPPTHAPESITPSVSTFNTSFPSIEDWDSQFGQADSLPSGPASQLPLFPSAPTTEIGHKAPKAGAAPSSHGLNLLKGVPTSPHFSNPTSTSTSMPTSRPSSRPASISSPPLPSSHLSNGISASLRLSEAGPSSSPAPPVVASSTRPSRKPDLRITTTLHPKDLRSYLDRKQYPDLSVLLLDVRSRELFEKAHIDSINIACIDPTVLVRPDMNSVLALENTLIVNPRTEENTFRNRNAYDLVVVYDESSTSFSAPHLKRLQQLIYQPEVVRTLKRPPMILVGGLKQWKADVGLEGLAGKDVFNQRPDGKTTEVVQSSQQLANGRTGAIHSHLSGSTPNGLPNGTSRNTPPSEQGRPRRDSYRNSMSPIDAAEKDLRRRAHVRDGAVFEPVPSSQINVDTTSQSPEDVGIRRSTLVRPSSSGTISAFHRVLPEIAGGVYAGHVPITYPSRVMSPTAASPSASFGAQSPYAGQQPAAPPLVAQPPQASLSRSPMARRRSEYVEQSIFGSSAYPSGMVRTAIDYPSLSSEHMVRRPEPVASNAMERQELPRRTLNPTYAPPKPGPELAPVIGGKTFQMPEKMPQNYVVQYWSDTQIGMSGLRNMGNTCYMNSILQCVSATVPFARFFIDGRWRNTVNLQNPLGKNGKIAEAFANMVYLMWQSELPHLVPKEFRDSVCVWAPQFRGADQHDSQEFLSFLLDGLHEDLNRVLRKPIMPSPSPDREKELETLPQQIASAQEWQLYRMRDDSVVVDYFQGQFRNRLTCLTCQHTSTTYNTFMYLSLPIPTGRGMSKVKLQQCLDEFVKTEVMEKTDAWKCPNCKVLRKATKQLSLCRLPPVLLIHLKRFSFKGPFTDKLETMVDFPLKELDLTNYMPPLLHPKDDKSGFGGQRAYGVDDPRAQLPPYKYDLYGVTNHYGSLSSGHYTSHIASKGGWVYCDDSRLSTVDPREVVGRPAYILFYRRVRN